MLSVAPRLRRARGTGPLRERGHRRLLDYRPWFGQIHIDRNGMLNPLVVVSGNMALLTSNLVNYLNDDSVGSRWNSMTVYGRESDGWKTIPSHWSCTRHPAFQTMTAVVIEGVGGGARKSLGMITCETRQGRLPR